MDALLPERKFSQKWHVKGLLTLILLMLILITATQSIGEFSEFSWDQFFEIWKEMAHPDWSYFPVIIDPLLQTIQMALVGTLLGTLLALPFSLLASRNIMKNKFILSVVRFFLNIVRAIPDMLLAAIFVAIVGIGPMAGVGALTIFSFGMVSKLFYESIETIDEGPVEALTAAGANHVQTIFFSVIPQVFNQFLSYFLYTLEINVRASTVLGYLGAGGVGLYLDQTLSMFLYSRTAIVIIGILIVVVVVDGISNYLREALA
ncbi:phosphonate ABC transporter, permease protein PhnE [Weissella viridescens]|mgnify:CR=1 FL=1|uniref:phosphonate ABC transporter, permease protein PhnE n=1 Tax=Weissella viridescens TaxID=1629 RepID=UPI0017473754|nr:phosphonate ABC transporter, permease protein PhnE [Weissella viridescens]QOD86025.1 phosphonate ABC transporter, permease protein PhnE [Weissella viridescens]WJI91151.1 phosphonate ABC transporter, permease protein PhnE [Weissella viridescens]